MQHFAEGHFSKRTKLSVLDFPVADLKIPTHQSLSVCLLGYDSVFDFKVMLFKKTISGVLNSVRGA